MALNIHGPAIILSSLLYGTSGVQRICTGDSPACFGFPVYNPAHHKARIFFLFCCENTPVHGTDLN